MYNRVLQKPFLFESLNNNNNNGHMTVNSKSSTHIHKNLSGKKLKKTGKSSKVIKNIEPIDMSESNMNQEYYYNKNDAKNGQNNHNNDEDSSERQYIMQQQ